MKLYKIEQNVVTDWDTYSDAVVCAVDEADAKSIHPCTDGQVPTPNDKGDFVLPDEEYVWRDWAENVKDVVATYLGEADDRVPRGVVVASYHAG